MSATAVGVRTVELLRFTPESIRTEAFFRALLTAAPVSSVAIAETRAYTGLADWLVLWGPGAPDRFGPMRQQIAGGGHVLAFDLAYWQRDRKVRVAIDGAHPEAWIMRRTEPPSRRRDDRVVVSDRWAVDGPVIVAGIGEKARVQYGGAVVDRWEREQIARARAMGRRVLYRPKGALPAPRDLVVELARRGPIEETLRGASAVMTYHSNVAVDAITLGIPVICAAGAAAAVCGHTWPTTGLPAPLAPALRDRFLDNLAWYQWAPSEAAALWAWVLEVLV